MSPSDRSGTPAAQPSLPQLIREDFETHGRSWVSAGVHALAVHRIGTWLYLDDGKAARWARPLHRVARAFVQGVYGIELPTRARIGRRLLLPHPHGVVVVSGATIGDDCMIRHNVTVGAGSHTRGGRPTIGDRVQFGPGSIVMGAVCVGDDTLIGPGAVVIDDVPAGSRVLAPVATARPPARPGAPAPGSEVHQEGRP